MADNNDEETKKVFDITKPGKTMASAGARPVIVGHKNMLKDPMVTATDVSELTEGTKKNMDSELEPEDKPSGSPSAVADEQEKEDATPSIKNVKIQPRGEAQTDKSEESDKPKADEPAKADTAEVESETSESEPDNQPDEKDEDKDDESESDDSDTTTISTDSAGQTEAQKKAEKQTQQSQAKQEALDKLIADQKYFVPISKSRNKRSLNLIILIVIAAAVIVGAMIFMKNMTK